MTIYGPCSHIGQQKLNREPDVALSKASHPHGVLNQMLSCRSYLTPQRSTRVCYVIPSNSATLRLCQLRRRSVQGIYEVHAEELCNLMPKYVNADGDQGSGTSCDSKMFWELLTNGVTDLYKKFNETFPKSVRFSSRPNFNLGHIRTGGVVKFLSIVFFSISPIVWVSYRFPLLTVF